MERRLYRAAWVAAMTKSLPLIADGGVLVGDGRILEVGRFQDLKSEAAVVKEVDGIITPALINAHCHLELSYLAELCAGNASWSGSFPDWIRALLTKREEMGLGKIIQDAGRLALAGLVDEGVAVICDIGNLADSRLLGQDMLPRVLFFQELYGLSSAAQEKNLAALDSLSPDQAVTGHALYSTGARLLVALKQRALEFGRIFPLHVAESVDEIYFLKTGQGPFREFLEERGVWDGSFATPNQGAVSYLERLGLLDQQTLCVHCVHVEIDEIRLLAKRKAKVCLCPGSNRYLNVGRPPVEAFIKHSIPLAIGTDSLTSNPELSLWREMRLLQEDHPSIAPELIFYMATQGGAEVLGLEAEWGTLASGKSARMLQVLSPALSKASEVFEYLVLTGGNRKITWLN